MRGARQALGWLRTFPSSSRNSKLNTAEFQHENWIINVVRTGLMRHPRLRI